MNLREHFTHPQIELIFADEQSINRWVEVEIALAKVQAEIGIISEPLPNLDSFQPDYNKLSSALEKSGVPIAELVKQIKAHVGDDHAQFVHYGATTQDILDTALVLQLRDSLAIIEPLLESLITQLAYLADNHRATVIVGRTRSQAALPTTFGLKVANWLAPLLRQRIRLSGLKPRLLNVQFGGAVGNLSALGNDGLAVQTTLAKNLGLGVPVTTWHTQRDTLAEFASWLSLTTGALATMAQTIILMAQSEVAELTESDDPTRGGSSTMPQKRNPIVSESILTIHQTNVGHLTALHASLPHEHERATGNWQVEWLNLPPMVSYTACALEKADWLGRNLIVNTEQMSHNIAQTKGVLLAEAARLALAPFTADAKQIVRTATLTAIKENRHLRDVLAETVDFPLELGNERAYLGANDTLIDNILKEATL